MNSLQDGFLAGIKRGDSISVLASVSEWSNEFHNLDVVQYWFCDEPTIRPIQMLSPEDFKKCDICGQELFRVASDIPAINYGDSYLDRVSKNKHMVFVASSGRRFETCYGINRCFDRIGFKIDSDFSLEFSLSEAREFFFPDMDFDGFEAYLIESLEDVYDREVKPFLKKWLRKGIDKSSVVEFMSDFRNLDNKFISLYCRGELYNTFRNKILAIIGVEI